MTTIDYAEPTTTAYAMRAREILREELCVREREWESMTMGDLAEVIDVNMVLHEAIGAPERALDHIDEMNATADAYDWMFRGVRR